jgi:hypothetical protein
MKTKPENTSTPESFIAGFEAKQRNTVWPDATRNSQGVDEVLWKGAPGAPLVQRIGICIFGLTFMLLGACMFEVGYEKSSRLFGPNGRCVFSAGRKVFLNGFRKHKVFINDESVNPSADNTQPEPEPPPPAASP